MSIPCIALKQQGFFFSFLLVRSGCFGGEWIDPTVMSGDPGVSPEESHRGARMEVGRQFGLPFGSRGLFLICELVPVGWVFLKGTLLLSHFLVGGIASKHGLGDLFLHWFFLADFLNPTTRGVEGTYSVSRSTCKRRPSFLHIHRDSPETAGTCTKPSS